MEYRYLVYSLEFRITLLLHLRIHFAFWSLQRIASCMVCYENKVRHYVNIRVTKLSRITTFLWDTCRFEDFESYSCVSKMLYILCFAHPIVMGLSIMYISILNWQFFPYFSRKWLNFHIRFVMPNVSVTNRMFKDIYCFSFSIIPAKIGKLWKIF